MHTNARRRKADGGHGWCGLITMQPRKRFDFYVSKAGILGALLEVEALKDDPRVQLGFLVQFAVDYFAAAQPLPDLIAALRLKPRRSTPRLDHSLTIGRWDDRRNCSPCSPADWGAGSAKPLVGDDFTVALPAVRPTAAFGARRR